MPPMQAMWRVSLKKWNLPISPDIGLGIHYLQEDNPHLIGSELAQWYRGLDGQGTGKMQGMGIRRLSGSPG